MSQDQQPLFPSLQRNQQSGSKPRCHLLTSGPDYEVANRLTDLIGIDGVIVRDKDRWLPNGFSEIQEARLGTEGKSIIAEYAIRKALREWWLSVKSDFANTPNWDIAASCMIKDKPGLLLIEAKAHDVELRIEERGKPLKGVAGGQVSMNSRLNHERIGSAIQEASRLMSTSSGQPWALSRDLHYQMSNRFAWSCKLAELGIPVVVVYLGFLRADEMNAGKQSAFSCHDEWEALVRKHSAPLFAPTFWGQSINIAGTDLIPLIRSVEQTLRPFAA